MTNFSYKGHCVGEGWLDLLVANRQLGLLINFVPRESASRARPCRLTSSWRLGSLGVLAISPDRLQQY